MSLEKTVQKYMTPGKAHEFTSDSHLTSITDALILAKHIVRLQSDLAAEKTAREQFARDAVALSNQLKEMAIRHDYLAMELDMLKSHSLSERESDQRARAEAAEAKVKALEALAPSSEERRDGEKP